MKRYSLEIPFAHMGQLQELRDRTNGTDVLGHKAGSVILRRPAFTRLDADRAKWVMTFALEPVEIPDADLTPEMLGTFKDFSLVAEAKEIV